MNTKFGRKLDRVKDIIKSNKDLEAQIQVAAYFLANSNHSYSELCWMLAERQLKIENDVNFVADTDIKKKAEEIFYSGAIADKLCWLIAELDILVKEGYFDLI